MKYLLYILILSLLSVLLGIVLDIFIAITFYGFMAVSGITLKKLEEN
ncbi:hypothetical protein [Staphylococcus equorum]|nr:hypothetical protein [Staphylococcus equorum]MDK9857676.1 hypothetical protein [Staphylococcus equorum]MDK9863646.1 hypothetical protein [Staphylococcus equorum]MDK9874736.1 hypothetical protein [Staphylococcus equorum]MDW4353509.1 hypothetical protein [Staphylococcus saprophyticus]